MDARPILRELDARPKFFIWELDSVLIFFIGVGFGIITHELTVGSILGIGLVEVWKRLKVGRQKGFCLHWLYWHLPFRFFPSLPASARRYFLG